MKIKIKEGLEVSLWDRWEYKAEQKTVTLGQVIDYLEKTYKL